MSLISTSGLSAVAAGRTLFRGVDLRVESGRILAVTGPNGAGKTTLLRILCRLVPPATGDVRYGRSDLRVAMVFQKPLMLAATVLDNVAYPLKQRGVGAADRRARAMQVLEKSGLLHFAHRVATKLSGGEQQRVAVARALAIDPDVLLLDEPTSSLDEAATASTEAWLLELRSRIGIVLVSHDARQVERVADAVYRLEPGNGRTDDMPQRGRDASTGGSQLADPGLRTFRSGTRPSAKAPTPSSPPAMTGCRTCS